MSITDCKLTFLFIFYLCLIFNLQKKVRHKIVKSISMKKHIVTYFLLFNYNKIIYFLKEKNSQNAVLNQIKK